MWKLTRQDTNQTLTLHEQYLWKDEYDWQALAQSEPVYTLTGAVIVQQGTKQAGRKITLDGKDVWLTRGLIKTLQIWADVPNLKMNLLHPDGRSFVVVFDRPAMDNLTIIKGYAPFDQQDSDKVRADLHFFTI